MCGADIGPAKCETVLLARGGDAPDVNGANDQGYTAIH